MTDRPKDSRRGAEQGVASGWFAAALLVGWVVVSAAVAYPFFRPIYPRFSTICCSIRREPGASLLPKTRPHAGSAFASLGSSAPQT